MFSEAIFFYLFSPTYSIVLLCCLNSFTVAVNSDIWYPDNTNRSYLVCPAYWCPKTDLPAKRQRCCICHAQPLWQVSGDTTVHLNLEYIRRGGESRAFADVSSNDLSKSYLTLIHNHGFMSKIPNNICSFNRTVTMDLQHNKLTEVGNISCLVLLDELNLSFNEIRHIGNRTFHGLWNLRILTIRNNGLKTLDPETLLGDSVQIFNIDFSNNNLRIMEVSNVISESDFCEISYSGNKIEKLVNNNGFKLDPQNKTYHGGQVNFNNNNLTKFIDFENLGLTDISLLGSVFDYSFIMTDVKWDCDCSMEPYLELAEEVLHNVWRDYFNITCWNPPEHRGKSIPQMVREGHLDLLICNVTESCPRNCHCFKQPKERRNVVNCTNANLQRLPDELPQSSNLTLILTDNKIENFEYRPYLQNTSVLDLSGNSISHFSRNATSALKPSIKLNLANNSFTDLPREFQTLDPCSSHFGEVKLQCDCNSAWLKQWSEKAGIKNCGNVSKYICQTETGEVPIEQLDKNDICEEEKSYKSIYLAICFGLLSSVSFGFAVSAYSFRYEIYLVQRKYIYRFFKSKTSKILPVMKYDAFLSFNDENIELRYWVLKVLVTNLESSGYRLFVPCRDLPIGSIKEEVILDHILNSRNSIVVLCDCYKYGGSLWTQLEWKYIWHKFLDISERNVIVVNFDQLDTVDDMDQRLRAFVRLGYDIDFSNRNHDLNSKIKLQLGPPLIATPSKKNLKARFDPGIIYQKLNFQETDGKQSFEAVSTSELTTVHVDSINVQALQ